MFSVPYTRIYERNSGILVFIFDHSVNHCCYFDSMTHKDKLFIPTLNYAADITHHQQNGVVFESVIVNPHNYNGPLRTIPSNLIHGQNLLRYTLYSRIALSLNQKSWLYFNTVLLVLHQNDYLIQNPPRRFIFGESGFTKLTLKPQ